MRYNDFTKERAYEIWNLLPQHPRGSGPHARPVSGKVQNPVLRDHPQLARPHGLASPSRKSLDEIRANTRAENCDLVPEELNKQSDERWLDFVSKRSYNLAEIAQRFTCARKTIYNLSLSGAFEFKVLRSDRRVPDWSLQKFLQENVSDRAVNRELDFVKVGTLSRIPGWSILDHIERNCSEI